MAQRKGDWNDLSEYTQGRYRRKGITPEQYNAGTSIYPGESKRRREAKIAKLAAKQAPPPPPPQGTVLPGIDPPPGLTVDFETRTLFREGQLPEIIAEQTAFIQGFLAAAGGNRNAMTSGCSEVRIDPLEESMTTRKGLVVEPGPDRWQVEQDIWYEKS